MHPSDDPNNVNNGAQYHTGKPCIVKDCDKPAGTAWSPYWCQKHNAERLHEITSSLEAIADDMHRRRIRK
jgi:hypothetical protein